MLLVEQKNVRNPLFGHFAVKEPNKLFQRTNKMIAVPFIPSFCSACSFSFSSDTDGNFPSCISVWVFSLADKCPGYNHGCWAGVCHPAQHNRQTALWPGTMCITVTCVLWQTNVWSCHILLCLDSEDDRAEGNLVLWPPVPGQQRFLHLAQTEQEGEENVCANFTSLDDITWLTCQLDLNEDFIMAMVFIILLCHPIVAN